MRQQIQDWIGESISVKKTMMFSAVTAKQIITATNMIVDTLRSDGKLLVCGNGGSAGDSGHFVGELLNRFSNKRVDPLPALDLAAPNSTITAIANDYGYDFIFSKQIKALGKPGDTLFAISTSGASSNITQAMLHALHLGLNVILLTGDMNSGWDSEPLIHQIRVPSTRTPIIQEAHIMVIHIICSLIDEALEVE